MKSPNTKALKELIGNNLRKARIEISQQDIDRANKEIARKLEDVDKRLFQSMIYAKTERFD